MKALLVMVISAVITKCCLGLYEETDGGVRYLICHTEDNCIQVSPSALREIMKNPDTVTPEDMEEIMDIPDRRSSYLFRSRRADGSLRMDDDLKRSSSYLLRTRKSSIESRPTRGEYLFRTRKSSNLLDRPETRGSYLFRTRKSENQNMDRILRSQGKSYLFRTRR